MLQVAEKRVTASRKLRTMRIAWQSWLYARQQRARFEVHYYHYTRVCTYVIQDLRQRAIRVSSALAVVETFARWRVAVVGLQDRRQRVETAAAFRARLLQRAVIRNWFAAVKKSHSERVIMNTVAGKHMHFKLGHFFTVWINQVAERHRIRNAMLRAAEMHAHNLQVHVLNEWHKQAKLFATLRQRVALFAERFTRNTLRSYMKLWHSVFRHVSARNAIASAVKKKARLLHLKQSLKEWRHTFIMKRVYKKLYIRRKLRIMKTCINRLRVHNAHHRATQQVQLRATQERLRHAWRIWRDSMQVIAHVNRYVFASVDTLNNKLC